MEQAEEKRAWMCDGEDPASAAHSSCRDGVLGAFTKQYDSSMSVAGNIQQDSLLQKEDIVRNFPAGMTAVR